MVDGRKLREIIPTLQFTFQFTRELRQEDWKDMYQVLQLHQILKDFLQWSMNNKGSNLASSLEELGAGYQKICLKEIPFKDPMVITKGWNPNRKLKLLVEKEARIRENQATIQAIEEKLNPTEHNLICSGSQGVNAPDPQVASHHSATSRSVKKSHHYSQSEAHLRRKQG
ncbi:hypothetical protein O181_002785 [Austropuccinia psidii MF-1]|uniref:Uncharacterized protein n=1 Tax=Austropuccinia psidii MF-1 TaxID=1389203 RepID=A0A9Q3BD46_9BASI|nr:hypothetical protein [Austropuccinia psidii MF-1]